MPKKRTTAAATSAFIRSPCVANPKVSALNTDRTRGADTKSWSRKPQSLAVIMANPESSVTYTRSWAGAKNDAPARPTISVAGYLPRKSAPQAASKFNAYVCLGTQIAAAFCLILICNSCRGDTLVLSPRNIDLACWLLRKDEGFRTAMQNPDPSNIAPSGPVMSRPLVLSAPERARYAFAAAVMTFGLIGSFVWMLFLGWCLVDLVQTCLSCSCSLD